MSNEDFRTKLKQIARAKGRDLLDVFTDFTTVAACALAVQTREEEYLNVAKNYNRDELELFSHSLGALVAEMESAPYTDILGNFYAEVGSKFSRDTRGEFYTPQAINKLMAKITIDAKQVISKGVPVSVCEPTIGSGGIILALAEELALEKCVDLLRVTGKDISKNACDMAYINLTLWGVPACIEWGDTLRNTTNAVWKNIHWFRVGEDQRIAFRQLFNRLNKKPEQKADHSQKKDQANETMVDIPTYQMDFDLEFS